MASKLTPEQKALNKAATKLRDSAYNQRKSAYEAERKSADAVFASSDVVRAAIKADDAFDTALEGRNAALDSIREQIAALQQKLAETELEYNARLEPLKAARHAAWDSRRKAEADLKTAVDEKYPDVADCWSAAQWKPFDEFLPLVTNNQAGNLDHENPQAKA